MKSPVSPVVSFAVLLLISCSARADDWPQWLGPQRDGVWRESGIVDRFPAGGPPVRWRVPIGAGYSGPAVDHGRVYVMDRQLATGASNPGNPFQRGAIQGAERILCLNEVDGKIVWQHSYDCPYTVSYAAGPRCTPLVRDGHVYTLGTEGNLFCLDAASGKVIWERDFKKDFGARTPTWGFAGHPLLDGQKLICLVGGEGSVAVAFDKDTGKELWRALNAREPGYCPPTLINAGSTRQLIIWDPDAVNALDPEKPGRCFGRNRGLCARALASPSRARRGTSSFSLPFTMAHIFSGSILPSPTPLSCGKVSASARRTPTS